MHYLGLCCIAKDEDPFLKEWIAYHHILGVEHFYIYDNMSHTPIREALGAFADSKQITIRRIAGKAMQRVAYQNCLDDFRSDCFWLGFIDIDEFVCLLRDNDLRVLLSEFEDYAGLGIGWEFFSSSGHLKRPSAPVLESYTERLLVKETPENIHIKSFVQPARTLEAINPHVFRYAEGDFSVNDEHFPIPRLSSFTFSSHAKVKLNHYFYRSQQDYEEKLTRGRADVGDTGTRKMDMFYKQASLPTEKETSILRHMPKLKSLMAAQKLPAPPAYLSTELELFQTMEMVADLTSVGQWEKAAVLLCHAALKYSTCADLWTTRALLARVSGDLKRAEIFLRTALRHDETVNAYKELISLYQAQKNMPDNLKAHIFLSNYLKLCPELFVLEPTDKEQEDS